MALKEKIVQGATCVCQFGSLPDQLKVHTHTKHYINDSNGDSKLAATHKDIGQTFANNSFGTCKCQFGLFGYKKCQTIVTEWSGYYENEIYKPHNGYILVEDSKATCPIGGKDCISILKSGQIGEPIPQNLQSADPELQIHVNSLIDMTNYEMKLNHKIEL